MARFKFIKSQKPSDILESDWNSWGWQLRNALKNRADFEKYFQLFPEEIFAFEKGQDIFNIRATPYYASLCEKKSSDPLRKILMPHISELTLSSAQWKDPLGEKRNSPVPRIIHRYSDRALFLVTDICSVYCRYCTRKYFTGHDQAFIKSDEFEEAISYIKKTHSLREIILSGGDPLTLSDHQLEKVLSRLREIDHIEIIRIGSRMPVVCPQRINIDLVKMLKKYKPVFLMTHFNHPREITEEAAIGLECFVDHGIPVLNQMVLLNGVNNHPALVQALNRRLLFLRVKPYYMFQCDPSEGTDHLRTSIENSLDIQKQLWGHLSGLALPTLSLDIPNGGGKTTLVPNFEISRSDHSRTYKGWDGITADYVNPPQDLFELPADYEVYQSEWEQIKR